VGRWRQRVVRAYQTEMRYYDTLSPPSSLHALQDMPQAFLSERHGIM